MKLKTLCETYDEFYFDLDKTIWNTYNKFGNEIWAKQMLFPLTVSTEIELCIVDDVGTKCLLQPGVRQVLEFLHANNKRMKYISCGARFESGQQPSDILLRSFGIQHYFNQFGSILKYKTYNKADAFENIQTNVVLFDDDDDVIQKVCQNSSVKIINRKNFSSWTDLL